MADGPYSSGKYAYGLCDICGFQYRLNQLKYVFVHGKNTHVKACPKCWDPDHPINFLPEAAKAAGADPQQLRDPRPEVLPKVYQVKYQPGSLALGDVATVIATGIFAGYTIATVSDDTNITIASAVLLGPQKAMMTITVGLSASAGQHVIGIVDVSGNTKNGLLTIT